MDVFDMSFCSPPGEYVILSIIIPGRQRRQELGSLRRAVRLGVTNWAKIPPLQVANIEVGNVCGERGA